jgi:hypothetical protein
VWLERCGLRGQDRREGVTRSVTWAAKSVTRGAKSVTGMSQNGRDGSWHMIAAQ